MTRNQGIVLGGLAVAAASCTALLLRPTGAAVSAPPQAGALVEATCRYGISVPNAVAGEIVVAAGEPVIVVALPDVGGESWPKDTFVRPAVNVFQRPDRGGDLEYVGYYVSDLGGHLIEAGTLSRGADPITFDLPPGSYRALVTLHKPDEAPSGREPDLESEADLGARVALKGVDILVH